MNIFVLLACIAFLIDLSVARPDVSLGYRYNQGLSSSGADFLQGPSVGPNSYATTVSGNSYFNGPSPSFGQFLPSNIQPGNNGIRYTKPYNNFNNKINYNDEQDDYLNHLHHHEAPIVTKHFYIHSAPIDHDEEQLVRHINVGRPQKNYRVVFIDAPSSTVTKTKIIAKVAPVEDKTAIYVLSKKASVADISAAIVTPPPEQNKPEVFFIKYKTPEEAIHAQHTIQAQYDALGGTSDITNEGSIPISSVIGSLDHDDTHGHLHDVSAQNIESAVSDLPIASKNQQIYLPPQYKN